MNLIAFYGDDEAGLKAIEVARELGLYPECVRRVWDFAFDNGENPHWELVFFYSSDDHERDASCEVSGNGYKGADGDLSHLVPDQALGSRF